MHATLQYSWHLMDLTISFLMGYRKWPTISLWMISPFNFYFFPFRLSSFARSVSEEGVSLRTNNHSIRFDSIRFDSRACSDVQEQSMSLFIEHFENVLPLHAQCCNVHFLWDHRRESDKLYHSMKPSINYFRISHWLIHVDSFIHLFVCFLDFSFLGDQRLKNECAPQYTSECASMMDAQESSRLG